MALEAIVLASGSAAAKGPFEIVVSGGDLVAPVTIPNYDGGLFPSSSPLREPLTPVPVGYKVDIFQVSEQGKSLFQALTYYPSGNSDGRLRSRPADEWVAIDPTVTERVNQQVIDGDREWYGVDTAFGEILDREIAAAPRALASTGGPPPSDLGPVALLVALGLALALSGGWLAGWVLVTGRDKG